jgi:hypothetical protein
MAIVPVMSCGPEADDREFLVDLRGGSAEKHSSKHLGIYAYDKD